MPGILTQWLEAAMSEATSEEMPKGYFYAEILPCQGTWATGDTKEEALCTLGEVLEEWLFLKLRDGDMDLPVLGGVDLNKKWEEKIEVPDSRRR